jgi:hypothetical protein
MQQPKTRTPQRQRSFYAPHIVLLVAVLSLYISATKAMPLAELSLQNGCTAGMSVAALDASHRVLYLACFSENRVLRFDGVDALNASSTASVAFGQPNLASTTSPTSPTAYNMIPRSLFVDSLGTLWVGDAQRRVVWWRDAWLRGSGEAADGVLGQPDFVTSLAGSSGPQYISIPVSLWVHNHTLWVAEWENHRYRLPVPPPPPLPPPPLSFFIYLFIFFLG